MKRSGKFYRRNEAEVMQSLGFEPTPNSGSGWISKEDGQNDVALCQLKSTDASSIKVNQQDISKLEYNAMVSHKVPVFAIQFLQSDEVFLVIRPENLFSVCEAVANNGKLTSQQKFQTSQKGEFDELMGNLRKRKRPVVKSGDEARSAFLEEHCKQYVKRGKPAK